MTASRKWVEYAVAKKFGARAKGLAEAMDVSEGTVSRWRKGATGIDTENLERLANILGVSLNEILNGEPPTTVGAGVAYSRNNPGDKWMGVPDSDPELVAAVQWHLRQGADPDDIELATLRVRSEIDSSEHPGRKKLAVMIQRWLDRVRDLG